MEIYVHPNIWNLATAEQKENLTYNLSAWHNCVVRPTWKDSDGESLGKGDYFHSVTLYDMLSGRKLATIGVFRGFRILG